MKPKHRKRVLRPGQRLGAANSIIDLLGGAAWFTTDSWTLQRTRAACSTITPRLVTIVLKHQGWQ